MDLRAYSRAKEAYEQDLKVPMDQRRNDPVIDKVRSITFELAKERIAERLAKEQNDQRR